MIVALLQQGAPLVSAPADTTYRVVYDLASETYHVWPPVYLFMFLFLPLMFVIDVIRNVLAGRPAFTRKFLVWKLLFAAAFILWQINWIRMDRAGWERSRREYLAGEYEVVEGAVTNFEPETRGSFESFSVNGHRYTYSSRMWGFHQSNMIGGPMREGLHVRIRDMGGRIAKLEIAGP